MDFTNTVRWSPELSTKEVLVGAGISYFFLWKATFYLEIGLKVLPFEVSGRFNGNMFPRQTLGHRERVLPPSSGGPRGVGPMHPVRQQEDRFRSLRRKNQGQNYYLSHRGAVAQSVERPSKVPVLCNSADVGSKHAAAELRKKSLPRHLASSLKQKNAHFRKVAKKFFKSRWADVCSLFESKLETCLDLLVAYYVKYLTHFLLAPIGASSVLIGLTSLLVTVLSSKVLR